MQEFYCPNCGNLTEIFDMGFPGSESRGFTWGIQCVSPLGCGFAYVHLDGEQFIQITRCDPVPETVVKKEVDFHVVYTPKIGDKSQWGPFSDLTTARKKVEKLVDSMTGVDEPCYPTWRIIRHETTKTDMALY